MKTEQYNSKGALSPDRKHSKQPGSPPGSLVYTGEKKQGAVGLRLLQFTESAIRSSTETDINALLGKLDTAQVNWIHVTGLHDTTLIEALGRYFAIDALVLEDILHTAHMPKLEDHDSYVFLTLKLLTSRGPGSTIEQEHISMVLGEYYLITFLEYESDVFDVIRGFIHNGRGRLRKRGSDYLLYRLLDTIVDHYRVIFDEVEDHLALIEEDLQEKTGTEISEKILAAKKNLLVMRRTVMPLREAMRLLNQRDVSLFTESTYAFLNDVLDHLLDLSHNIEHAREMITGLMELHMAISANKMNNVMKTLTIFATIFMPLTFFAGIYGMNFEFMPELEWRWGYPLVLGAMAVIAGGLLAYMRRRRWL